MLAAIGVLVTLQGAKNLFIFLKNKLTYNGTKGIDTGSMGKQGTA